MRKWLIFNCCPNYDESDEIRVCVRASETYLGDANARDPSIEFGLRLHAHVFDVLRALLLNQWMLHRHEEERDRARYGSVIVNLESEAEVTGRFEFLLPTKSEE